MLPRKNERALRPPGPRPRYRSKIAHSYQPSSSSMTAFAATFLGHQGWMIRSGRTCVLVDPLLCEEFGDVHALQYRVYPPRVMRAEAFPPIDAVILSHEHDDHFDIPSLVRLDRRIPIFISVHSSIAAYEILRRIGFAVQPLVP